MGIVERCPERKNPNLSDWITERLTRLILHQLSTTETTEETEKNLNSIRAHLKEGSVVFYFSHVSLIDGPLVIAFLLSKIGPSINRMGALASLKHLDLARNWKNPKSLGETLMMRLAPTLKTELVPIIQDYDKSSYDPITDFNLLRSFIKKAKLILKEGGIFVIAPEGTRSPEGKLQKALFGVEHLGKYGENVAFVPVALFPEGTFSREFSFKDKWLIEVGEMVLAEDLSSKSTSSGVSSPTDVLMSKLAALLPENMRGVYE